MRYATGTAPSFHALPDQASFDAVKQRLHETSGCKNFYELADFLETTPAQLSDARRRLRIPVQWFRITFLKTKVNPHWLLTGTGEKELL